VKNDTVQTVVGAHGSLKFGCILAHNKQVVALPVAVQLQLLYEHQHCRNTLIQIGTVVTRTHLTVATGLSWSVAIVTMWHSSDGQPRCQWAMKLVATGER
jgi:hypothetical protein